MRLPRGLIIKARGGGSIMLIVGPASRPGVSKIGPAVIKPAPRRSRYEVYIIKEKQHLAESSCVSDIYNVCMREKEERE